MLYPVLHVSWMPTTRIKVSEDDIRALFGSVGEVKGIAIPYNSFPPHDQLGFALVEMGDLSLASRAMQVLQGKLLVGLAIKIVASNKPTVTKKQSGGVSSASTATIAKNSKSLYETASPVYNSSPYGAGPSSANSASMQFASIESYKGANVGSIACYEAHDQVGEGTYGYVYRAIDKRNGMEVALKRLIVHKDYMGFPLCALRELKFLKSLQHKNIVKLIDVAVSKGASHLDKAVRTERGVGAAGAGAEGAGGVAAPGGGKEETKKSERDKAKERDQEASSRVLQRCANLYLVFEYVEHDLGGLVDAKYKFQPIAVKSITKQLLEVLEFLESKKILHRDIKCSNILISSHHQIKLADFGLARSALSSTTGQEGRMDLTNNVVTMW